MSGYVINNGETQRAEEHTQGYFQLSQVYAGSNTPSILG